jgi:hypothetical protein
MTEEELRDRAIGRIGSLFPPDDSEIGKEMLKEIILEQYDLDDWRELPTNILTMLAARQMDRHDTETRRFLSCDDVLNPPNMLNPQAPGRRPGR